MQLQVAPKPCPVLLKPPGEYKDKELGGLAIGIPPFAKLLWSLFIIVVRPLCRFRGTNARREHYGKIQEKTL